MATEIPSIDTTLVPPNRSQAPDDYSDTADQWAADLSTAMAEMNASISAMNIVAEEAETAATNAEDAETAILGVSNFQGNWGDQSGSASVPYSVWHDNRVWVLREDIGDVTASEPSMINDDWGPISGDYTGGGSASLGSQLYDIGLVDTGSVVLDFDQGESFKVQLDDDATFSVTNIPGDARMNGSISVETNQYFITFGDDFIVTDNVKTEPGLGTSYFKGFNYFYLTDIDDDNYPGGFTFANSGNRIYISDVDYQVVARFDLDAPYEAISFDAYENAEHSYIDISSEVGTPGPIRMSADETKLFVMDLDDGTIYQYDLSTPGDFDTGSYSGTSYNSPEATGGKCFEFNQAGTKLYYGDGQRIYQYTLSGAYNISAPSYDSEMYNSFFSGMIEIRFDQSAVADTVLVVASESPNSALYLEVYELILDSPGVISSNSFGTILGIPTDSYFYNVVGMDFDYANGRLFLADYDDGSITELDFHTSEIAFKYRQLTDTKFALSNVLPAEFYIENQ